MSKHTRTTAMRLWIVAGALNGFLAVAFGAFAAHGLRGRVPDADLAIFQTGAHYHLVHAVALVAVGLAAAHLKHRGVSAAGWLFLAGIVLFSGSLYVPGFTGSRALVMLTPVGGTAFLAGWLALAWAAISAKHVST